MADEAVLDAPELEDVDLEGGEGESQESSESEGRESQEQQETQDEPSIVEADGKLKLSEKALNYLNEVKGKDPKFAREVKAALFDNATLRKEFPEGIREVIALKQELEEIGGIDAVNGMRGELDAWKGLDADWTGNKPQFAAEMAESNPASFAFHAPHVMSKFAEVAPEQFTHEVAKVFAADMGANDVVMQGRMLESVIFDEAGKVRQGMESAARNWAPIAQYIMRISNLAKNAPKQEAKPGKEQSSDIDQREQALTVREFGTERTNAFNSAAQSALKSALGNRKISESQASAISELYTNRLDKILRADKKHTDTIDRYISAKDKAGYAKHMRAAYNSPRAKAVMDAAVKTIVQGKPGPKVAAKSAPVKSASSANATTGFTRVGSKPLGNSIDWQATARIAGKKSGDGKYVLRDGAKVLYQR